MHIASSLHCKYFLLDHFLETHTPLAYHFLEKSGMGFSRMSQNTLDTSVWVTEPKNCF